MAGYLQLLGDCVNDLGVWIGSIHPTVPLLRVLHLYVDLAQLLLQARVLVDLEQKSQRENEVKFLCRSLEILDRAAEACLGKQVALVLHIKKDERHDRNIDHDWSKSKMKVKVPPQCEDLAPHRKSMLANLPLAGDPFARPKKKHDSQTIFLNNNYIHDDRTTYSSTYRRQAVDTNWRLFSPWTRCCFFHLWRWRWLWQRMIVNERAVSVILPLW